MDPRPGVSVVIPTYNRAELVLESVVSALDQDWDPLEVIVVDDASTDETVSRVRRLSDDDPRVRVIARERNGGESAARNDGIRAAVHDYVALLDSDNRFLPGKLERQIPPLVAGGPMAVSFTGYVLAGAASATPVTLSQWASDPEAVTEALLRSCCVNTSTFVAPRVTLADRGLFREDLRCCEDHELWLRLAGSGHRFLYEPESLTYYRFHEGSISADQARVAAGSELVISQFLGSADIPERFRRRRRYYAGRWALNAAVRYLEAGDVKQARRALLRSALARPMGVRPGWLTLALRTSLPVHRS